MRDIVLGVRFLNSKGERDLRTTLYYYKISKEIFDNWWFKGWFDQFGDKTIEDDAVYLIENENGYTYRDSRVTIEEVISSQEQIEKICSEREIVRLVKIAPIAGGTKYNHCITINKKSIAKKIKEAIAIENKFEFETKKGDNNMFESIFKDFDFGKANDVVFSINGPAFKTAENTYITKDKNGEGYTEVTGLTFNEMDSFCYKVPVSKDNIVVGDYVRHNNCWVRVVEVLDNGSLRVDKIFAQERVEIFPTKNVFGFDFYTKLVSLTDNLFAKSASASNPFGNILPFILMKDSGRSTKSLEKYLPLFLLGGNGMNFGDVGNGINPLFFLLANEDSKSSDLLPLLLMGRNVFGTKVEKDG